MAFISFTRMVERRVKYGDRSDLHSNALAPGSAIYVRADQVAAVSAMKVAVDHDGERTEVEPVTFLWLVGNSEPIPVVEPLDTVLAAIGAAPRPRRRAAR